MTQNEYRTKLLERLARKTTTFEIRELVKEASETLDEARFSETQKRAFFDDFIQAAQDNTATMDNAGEAQDIINQLLAGK